MAIVPFTLCSLCFRKLSMIPTIGSEIEIYKTPGGYMMMDLNSGKLGGGKRLGAFACLYEQASELEKKVENIARAYTWDVRHDCYVVFDIQLGIQEIEGTSYVSPLIHEVKKAIEERGYMVKGFIGRDKIFSEDPKNWKVVEVNDELQVKSISYDEHALEDLAESEAVYLGCHFAPPSCRKNQWDEDTCRNGFINNFIDLPGVNWLFMRGNQHSPYYNAVVFSRENELNIKDDSFPSIRGSDAIRQRLEEMRRQGQRYVVIKDISKMSIGGRGISFGDLDKPTTCEGIPSPALVMPYFPIEPTKTNEGDVIIQTRIIYSFEGKAKPQFVFAKMYLVNGMSPEPYNLSSFCTDFVVWDIRDYFYYLKSPSRGKLSCRKVSTTKNKGLRRHFESVIEQCMSDIGDVERGLQYMGTDQVKLLEFYRAMKKKKLVPGNIHPFLNLFNRGK